MIWNPSEGIDLGFFIIRFYSLMFVIAFGLGWYIMKKIFLRENESLEKLDSLFVWTIVATLLGARLGHVFFYDWEYFRNHPAEILLPVKFEPTFHFTGFAGLASHGAAIAIIVAMYFFSKKIMQKPLLWVLDRVVITVASGAVFVRLGNFFNSEIYGHKTDKNSFLATKFIQEEEYWQLNSVNQTTGIQNTKLAFQEITSNPKYAQIVNEIPYRYPAQLYEALCYIFVFAILWFMYWKTNLRKKLGFLFGMFLILLWSVRFFVEMVKESQGGFGDNTIFSTGQWLSLPFILIGLYFIIFAKKQDNKAVL